MSNPPLGAVAWRIGLDVDFMDTGFVCYICEPLAVRGEIGPSLAIPLLNQDRTIFPPPRLRVV